MKDKQKNKDAPAQKAFHSGGDNSIAHALMIGTERRLYEDGSGPQKRLFEYAKAFGELHVIVFSTAAHGLPKGPVKVGDNVMLYATNSRHRLTYVFSGIKLGHKIMAKAKDWLVTAQDPFECGLSAARLVRAHVGSRLHVQLHTDLLSPAFAREGLLNRLRVLIAAWVLPQASAVRVVSKRIADSLKTRGLVRCEPYVLPIYVDIAAIEKHVPALDLHALHPKFSFILLTASRLEKVKNVDLLLRAFAALPKKTRKGVGLVVVGDGTQRSALEKLAKKLGVERKVVFVGWQTDVVSHYQTADLFVNPSSYEGYCLSLVEAAASECPILTTDVGLVGEALNRDNVLIAEIDSVMSLQGQLTAALTDRPQLKKNAAAARVAVNGLIQTEADYYQQYRESFQRQ